MDLDTLTIDPEEAERQLREYGELRAPTDEDRAIIAGLVHLAQGKTLINLRHAIARGGLDGLGFPRLAVMRADRPWAYLRCGQHTDGRWDSDQGRYVHVKNGTARVTFVPTNGYDSRNTIEYSFDVPLACSSSYGRLRSQVPIIPPALRPPKTRLREYAVLWEVEEWAEAPAPPGDPALISPLGGDLWAVHGTWDLTPLERAVLGGRSLT